MNSQLFYRETVYTAEKKVKNTFELMNKAGKLSAKYINDKIPKKKILVLCGIGGNGGDGFILAQELKSKYKWQVIVSLVDSENKIEGDAKKAFKKLKIKPTKIKEINLNQIGYVIDAIFGIGLSRIIKDKYFDIIQKINISKLPVISLDIPSGIDSNTGDVLGITFNSFLTLTYSVYKVGQFLAPGRHHCGKVALVDIGLSKSSLQNTNYSIYLNSKKIWLKSIIWPKNNDHKYSRGYTLIIGGPRGMTGAARLAAIAAQRTGSGIVVLACKKDSADIYYKTLTSQIVKSYKNIKELQNIIKDPRINSVVIGPGLGQNSLTKTLIKNVILLSKNIIIDADAISCFKNDLNYLKNIVKTKNIIMTPHEGEYNKLFPNKKGSLIDKALFAAKELNIVIVLKSSTTVIASPENRVVVNEDSSKWLATAGSGDVLAGIIGALVSNKMSSFLAASYGVWLHSKAGQKFGPGLISDDIPNLIPKILNNLYNK